MSLAAWVRSRPKSAKRVGKGSGEIRTIGRERRDLRPGHVEQQLLELLAL
jgi:hypothetical protein